MCTAGGRASFVAGDGGAAESIQVQLVSGNFYQVLGVRPAIGRLISRMTTARPAPIRYRVNTGVMTVIGVSPAGFDGLEQGWSPDAGSDDDDRDGVPVGAAF
jgi:hypothetical protein